MSAFDWHAVACDGAVVELGALLRECFGVWVGFLDSEGGEIPVGDREVRLAKPPCEQIRVNPIEQPGGETTSCLRAVRGWVERAREEGRFSTDCHAGFRAHVVPVEPESAGFLGAVYVSGYLPEPEASERREEIEELLERNDLMSMVDREEVDAIPALDAGSRETLAAAANRLAAWVERRVERRSEEDELAVESDPPRFEGMIGATSRMREIFEDIATVAASDSSVLIQGENGTGKELVARALHRRSGRANYDFVALNCAAVPNELIESELFGHVEGAFSGAHRDREGLCIQADRGTLFLDEIGDMDRSLQSKLLRFLQDGRFTPVGANQSKSVDVRVICATNQNLEKLVDRGEFRKDLYFRINVVQIQIPPLRKRRTDIPLLVDHFLHRAAREHGREPPELTEECRRRLQNYEWPGNVRELENEIERLVIMAGREDEIGVDALSRRVEDAPEITGLPSVEGMTIPEATERLERKMILDGLRETGWNKTRTAEKLGVSRRNLIRKVSEYELEQYRDDGDE